MSVSTEGSIDVSRALQVWAEYQQHHDVSGRKGQTAGIDPSTGRVWFGESIVDIVQQMESEGVFTPLYYVRVGYDHYFRKGGHH